MTQHEKTNIRFVKGGIFLLSSERSGTNLLRDRLSRHCPEVCSIPPTHILRTLWYWEHLYGDPQEESNWRTMVDHARRCCYERAVPWQHQFETEEILAAYKSIHGTQKRSLIKLTDTLYRMYAAREEKTWYFCKDLWLFDFAPSLSKEINSTAFIHLYRDPRDYVLSQKLRPFGNQSAWELSQQWRDECNACLRAIGHLKNETCTLSISYEELIHDEEKFCFQVSNALQLSFVKKSEHLSSKSKSYGFHEWKNLHLPTDKSNKGKYLTGLNKYEIEVIESICWNTMVHLEYLLNSDKRPKLNFIHRLVTHYVKVSYSHLRRRINRYKLRKEPINRYATKALVAELEQNYR